MSPYTPNPIAAQNDAFRSMLHIPQFGTAAIQGQWLLTPGISALPPVAQIEIFAAIRSFDAFTPDNDPYGEHDFGALDHPDAGRILWKIDYYDPSLRHGSENPADPERTRRVLTIMLASEF